MAFQLPQQRDPNEAVRRFVSTALAARQQDQNESFQMQKSLVDMEAQQKRKELLTNAFKTSVDRIKSVYTKPSDEYNKEVEGEAMQYDMSAPEIAKAIRNNKRAEPKIVTRKLVDANGQTVERLEKFDPFLGVSTPIQGTDRIVDANQKVVTADTESGDTNVKKAITLNAKGRKVAETVIGSEPSKAKQEALKESKLPVEQRSSYRIALEKKNTATADALKYGKAIDDVNAQIEATAQSGGKTILFDNKVYNIGKDTETLIQNFNDKVVQAKKQEGEFQGLIDKMKNPKGTTATPATAKKGRWDAATGKIVYE
jgi:hypothetical protein